MSDRWSPRRAARQAAGACAVVLLALAGCGADPPGPALRIEGPSTLATEPGEPVRLTGIADGATVALTWDLGDGSTAAGATVEHTYREPGTYRVVLSTDQGSTGSPAAEVVVRVGDEAIAAAGNQALRFGGTGTHDVDRVKIPVDVAGRTFGADIGATDTTIELWLRMRPGDNPAPAAACGEADAWITGNVVLDRDRYNQGRKFGMSIADGVVVFGLTGEGGAVSMCGTGRVDDDRWHHVAVTRSAGDGMLRLFVDGVPEAEVSGPPGDVSYPDGAQPASECDGGPCTGSDPFLVIGAEKHDVGPDYPSYTGLVDELRLSTVIRYDAAFTPPSAAFQPDADTAALYHLDEGTGTAVRDAVGGPTASDGILNIGGTPPGPAWVASDAPTGP